MVATTRPDEVGIIAFCYASYQPNKPGEKIVSSLRGVPTREQQVRLEQIFGEADIPLQIELKPEMNRTFLSFPNNLENSAAVKALQEKYDPATKMRVLRERLDQEWKNPTRNVDAINILSEQSMEADLVMKHAWWRHRTLHFPAARRLMEEVKQVIFSKGWEKDVEGEEFYNKALPYRLYSPQCEAAEDIFSTKGKGVTNWFEDHYESRDEVEALIDDPSGNSNHISNSSRISISKEMYDEIVAPKLGQHRGA